MIEFVDVMVCMGVVFMSVLNCYCAMLNNRARITILEQRANIQEKRIDQIIYFGEKEDE